jgi:hypothetical protein
MLIKIVDRFTASGNPFYEWWLYSGPDGAEEVHGYATDLVTAFSKLLEWNERIAADYANDFNNSETNQPD